MRMGKLQLWLCFGTGNCSPGAGLPVTPLAPYWECLCEEPLPITSMAPGPTGTSKGWLEASKLSGTKEVLRLEGGDAAHQMHAGLGTAQWSCSGRKAAAVHEPSHRSPGAPSSALLPHQAYLKLPTCHWDQRQGLGWEGRVSAGPLAKLTAGPKTSNLNPIFSPPGILTHF